ncbi:hypothetical protein EYE40_11330 [Glaciihabitans arcticus]|uniref:Zinc finger DksA/TraR C4-type domain-containing protein n=1 Tax=Glaciihabitans arcticus TaxID=2668039 RepID=A0A4Q9GTA1_9MICO|nr:TraR/DksA family transcriptional regulator [Glaciihabitans arcticus]TBN57941.1 hypothetical protein EYE40_11330 [Glaciihabitans arcticus]
MTPTVAALDSRQRGALRKRLLADRASTLDSVAQLGFDIDSVRHSRRDSSTDDEHDPEGSTLAFEQSQTSALLRQAVHRIDQIDDALGRLDDDSYGSCASCGRSIGYARLSARPYTPHCVTCAARLNP